MTLTKILAGAALGALVAGAALAAEATNFGVPSLPLGSVTFPTAR
jgi:hypothetical protein